LLPVGEYYYAISPDTNSTYFLKTLFAEAKILYFFRQTSHTSHIWIGAKLRVALVTERAFNFSRHYLCMRWLIPSPNRAAKNIA